MDDEKELIHDGTPRHSGRYPWGSGKKPSQRNKSLSNVVDDLKRKGVSETNIAKGLGISSSKLDTQKTLLKENIKKADQSKTIDKYTDFRKKVSELESKGLSQVEVAKALDMNTSQLRIQKSLAKAELRKPLEEQAANLKSQGLSNVAIGKEMGLNESSIRGLLNVETKAKNNLTNETASFLKEAVKDRGLIDVGVGAELYLNISRPKLKTAIGLLKEEGYVTHEITMDQLGTGGNKKTTILVLAPPGTEYKDVRKNQYDIKMVKEYHVDDNGKSYFGIEPPKSIDSSRVKIRYAEEGGKDKDGVIELRRGVDDISLGNSKYAQVRIAVDGTHYLKGMAMYSDDLPKGVDIMFNTNKHLGTDKMSVIKPMKTVSETDHTIDKDNPFGAALKVNGQAHYTDKNGKDQLSCINKVNEEGDWDKWHKSLSSQMLSKQHVSLAKQQLGLVYDSKKKEFDEITALTNPTVKKQLLDAFADGCDSAAVHLKAAAMPRQGAHVILPITSLKETEVYAPNYENGEHVVLIRHPHGGTFEIPDLVVNNKHAEAKKLLGNAKDAIGIHPNVAEKLSGADFDGDSVLVIPNKGGKTIKTSESLEGLKGFDPKEQYKEYPGMVRMTEHGKGMEMGKASNLITDMTIRGASLPEICRAVKYSMVVIDAEKHHLDYKQAYIDNGISELKKSYQTVSGGASTIISRASSDIRVGTRKEKAVNNMTPEELADYNNGKKVYEYDNATYTKITKLKDGTIKEEVKPKTIVSTKMYEETDANNLSSGTLMESAYANHANKLKSLANDSRKESLTTKTIPYSPSANKTYAKEVASLNSSLNIALKNAPMERQAQILANSIIQSKKNDNPDISKSDMKKFKGQALQEARSRIGATKKNVEISDKEWEAIQAGAVTTNVLTKILKNTDLDKIKQLATPRDTITIPAATISRAKLMLASGKTQSEVAKALGISVSSVSKLL